MHSFSDYFSQIAGLRYALNSSQRPDPYLVIQPYNSLGGVIRPVTGALADILPAMLLLLALSAVILKRPKK